MLRGLDEYVIVDKQGWLKKGEFWRTRGREKKMRSFKEEYEELEVLAIKNHKFCFDIM